MIEEPFKIVMVAESNALKQQVKRVATKEDYSFSVESSLENLYRRLTNEQHDLVIITSRVVKKRYELHQVEQMLNDFALQSTHTQIILLIEPEEDRKSVV